MVAWVIDCKLLTMAVDDEGLKRRSVNVSVSLCSP